MFAMDSQTLRSTIDDFQRRIRTKSAPVKVPSAETREAVRLWETNVAETGEYIRQADEFLSIIRALPDADPDRLYLEREVAGARRSMLELMMQLDPDQAWFWTEEWQAKMREADADLASGRSTVYYSNEEFDAALRARMTDAHV
jgi:hypothetical protein